MAALPIHSLAAAYHPMDTLLLPMIIGAAIGLGTLFLIFSGPRALSFLIGRYLRKRRIAWVSLIAVMLCTTMVLVVISVMGGWIRMFRESFHNIGGDVVVQSKRLAYALSISPTFCTVSL